MKKRIGDKELEAFSIKICEGTLNDPIMDEVNTILALDLLLGIYLKKKLKLK